MELTKEQEKMLSGERGKAVQKAMEILTGLGDIYGAEKFTPVQSAHVSGVSIRTAGDAGLNFIEEMVEEGAKVTVPTTINPAALDLRDWDEMGVPEEISRKQIRIIDAYREMGADPVCSCIPYLVGNEPSQGQHIAWSESSAVIYANSVLGARTHREGAPSALASAVTGLTPVYGYHLDENRSGSVGIRPDPDLFAGGGTFQFSVLGYWVGANFPESVPVIENLHPNPEQEKALGAGMATSGAIALYHIPRVTPEAKENPEICETDEEASFGTEEFEEVRGELDQTSEADIVCLGCPHASEEELRRLSCMDVENEVWVHIPRKLRKRPDMKEVYQRLREKSVKLVCDTCMVVSPLSEMGYSSIGVNSAKAAYYAPLLGDVEVHFAPLEGLIK
ncbi:hypothetical protein AKJ41_02670 [candidate division MSBL1 archaeon SCGC-AAA259O05]|uniref:Phosphomevalonate dehydratase large subunit n=1 Tax=candidate division MSBL1 archaeon SCGC-AAA259O05 TaxID=1698271 RepID=A0A133V3V5_9EURY|nr:hypothetical protein AKJ41_02670 [candidate division MSBL1 archaeon SCGC-AAA259O05]